MLQYVSAYFSNGLFRLDTRRNLARNTNRLETTNSNMNYMQRLKRKLLLAFCNCQLLVRPSMVGSSYTPQCLYGLLSKTVTYEHSFHIIMLLGISWTL